VGFIYPEECKEGQKRAAELSKRMGAKRGRERKRNDNHSGGQRLRELSAQNAKAKGGSK